MKHRKFLALALVPPFLLINLINATSAQAGNRAIIQQSYTASIASWGTQLATSTGAGSTSTYQIVWTGNKNNQNELFSIINSGSIDLISSHIIFSSAKPNGDTTNPPTLIFQLCSGTWDATTFACSGTVTTAGSSTSGTIDFIRSIPVGGRIVVLVNNARNSNSNWNTSINSYVSRTDLRAGVIRNS